MDERPTKTLTTSGGHEIVLKEWITGREKRQIDNILLSKVEMKQKGMDQEISGFNPQLMAAAEDEALRLIVVSVDGKTENVVDAILSLPAREYDEVIAAVREVKDGLADKKK